MEAYKSISLLCLAAVVFSCCEAAVPLQARRATCRDEVTGKGYGVGDTWYTDGTRQCMSLTCEDNDSITGLTCAPFQVPSWCTVQPGDVKAVYPGCCPTPVCPEDNAIEGSSGPASGASTFTDSYNFGGYPYPPAL